MSRCGRALVFLAALASAGGRAWAEWQVSADARAGAVASEELSDTTNVQPWGVDTVTGATPRVAERFLAGSANVTASFVEAAAARVFGLHAVGMGGRPSPYTTLRLSNLILAWHGSAGALEAGYVLTPSRWGQGLLLNRLQFAGGRARIDWGESGQTEGLWTDTVEDPARFRYYELTQTGVHHETAFPGGNVGVSVLDARRPQPDVFPKRNSSQGTFASVDADYAPDTSGWIRTELGYGWLSDGKRTAAGTLETRWDAASGLQAVAGGWYLGPHFNPAAGSLGRFGVEEGGARLGVLWKAEEFGLELRPAWGWKQQYAGNFWAPSIEALCQWAPWGLTLRVLESAEQPWGRWGDVDHWEYTQAALAVQVATPVTLLVRWEKIFDGFDRLKSQQLSGEIGYKF